MLQEFHILPEEGGLLDQDEYLIDDINLCWWWKMLARNKVEKDIEEEKKALEFAKAHG